MNSTSRQFIIGNLEYTFQEDIPLEIFDIINQSMENTADFLSDSDNIIFKTESIFVGMSKYFYPFDDRSIVYDCGTKNIGQITQSIFNDPTQNLPYFNMESIGITLEPPNRDIGILVKAMDLENILQTAKIVRLDLSDPNFIIKSLASKAVIEGGGNYSYIGALHCQGNYIGQVFNLVDLFESIKEIPVEQELVKVTLLDSNQESFYIKANFKNLNFNPSLNEYTTHSRKDFKAIEMLSKSPSFFNLEKKVRNYLIDVVGYINPLGYPDEYFKICEKESKYRNLQGYDNLINLNEITLRQDDSMFDENKILSPKNNEMYSGNFDHKIIKLIEKFKDNVVIAGGYALYRFFEYNGKNMSYSDVDFFIHSCTEERAREIILLIVDLIKQTYRYVDVMNSQHAYTLKIQFKNKIQFIKRLYQSPSEIIHGFDVDCACILMTLDNLPLFYATERGYYAIKNKCNFINFDHLSPSYEHRCLKYLERNFDLFIPQMTYFKQNVSFDQNAYPNPLRGGYIILKYLINGYRLTSNISDYEILSHDDREFFWYLLPENDISFVVTNPNLQTTSTFNVTVHEDNINWYPKGSSTFYIPPFDFSNQIIEITKESLSIKREEITGKNIISTKKIKTKEYIHQDVLTRLLKIFPKQFVIVGDVPLGMLTGTTFLSPICICFMESEDVKEFKDAKDVVNMLIDGFKNFYSRRYFFSNHNYIFIYNQTDHTNYIEVSYEDIDKSFHDDFKIPRLQISKKIYTDYNQVLDTQKYDFQRIIFDGKYYTDRKGEYCIYHQINLNKLYLLNDYQLKGYKGLLLSEDFTKFVSEEEFNECANEIFSNSKYAPRETIECFGIRQTIYKDYLNDNQIPLVVAQFNEYQKNNQSEFLTNYVIQNSNRSLSNRESETQDEDDDYEPYRSPPDHRSENQDEDEYLYSSHSYRSENQDEDEYDDYRPHSPFMDPPTFQPGFESQESALSEIIQRSDVQFFGRSMNIGTGLLNLSNLHLRNEDLEGIQWPQELQSLSLNNNRLTTFDTSSLPQGLLELNLNHNQLTTFDTSSLPQGLLDLYLRYNQLTNFDASSLPPGLRLLNLSHNQLTTFDTSSLPQGLLDLFLNNNRLTTFDTASLPEGLQVLYLSHNRLTNFDTSSLPPGLRSFECEEEII
jgi:hypothetical protein